MYCGHSGKDLLFVSKDRIKSSQADVVEVPSPLNKLHPDELLKNYEIWRGKFVLKGQTRPPELLRVAFVSVYQIDCGIATYAGWLYPEIIKHIGEYRIFAEHAISSATDAPFVVRCWKRGEPLTGLIEQIEEFDPDVVLIQHEFGIFPSARHWLSFITKMRRYRTIVTLHSVFRHKDKTICEAAIPEIVVHTELGKNVLVDEKNIPGRVHVIPHGSIPVANEEKYWNIYHSKKTLVQFGFGFRYKGWEQAIDAVAQLKSSHPDVFFTGLFSESTYSLPMHQRYYLELEARVKALGVGQHVGIIRGYLHERILEAYLRTNGIAIFPYLENGEHTVFGCSGAARIAMHYNIPVIVSQAPHFHDLEGICPRVASVEDLCKEIEQLWADPSRCELQLKRQQVFLHKTSWANVALAYTDLMKLA